MHRATPSGARSIFTPSCSSTSAEPHSEEAARLPCLATRAPHAAATIAAKVEMLKVASPSPPVPQVSSSAPPTSIGVAIARAVRAKPVISSAVSPFMRSATSNPAIWPCVASPRMMASNADAASSSVRFSHRTSFAIVSINLSPPRSPGRSRRRRGWGHVPGSVASCRNLRASPNEVAENLLAFLRQHRLRVELHAVRRVLDVAQSHHRPVHRPRGDHQIGRHRRAFHDERVIPRGLEWIGHSRHHARVVVPNPRSLAMPGLVADHVAAERLAKTLMSKTHAQNRDLPAQLADRVHRDACVIWRAGSWRDDDAVELCELRDAHPVVAKHGWLGPHLPHALHHVFAEH